MKQDLTTQSNTRLSPDNEKQFKAWARKEGRIGELVDYDLRGAWLAGLTDKGRLKRFEKAKPAKKSSAKKEVATSEPQPQQEEKSKWTFKKSSKKSSRTSSSSES